MLCGLILLSQIPPKLWLKLFLYVQYTLMMRELTQMHAKQSNLPQSYSCGGLTDIYVLLQQITPYGPCQTSMHCAASDTHIPIHLSASHRTRGSLLYCKNLHLESAFATFLTLTVNRSTGGYFFLKIPVCIKHYKMYILHTFIALSQRIQTEQINTKYIPVQLHYQPDDFQCIFFKMVARHISNSTVVVVIRRKVSSLAILEIFFLEHVLKQPFLFMHLYALFLL